jgi:ribokinase
MYAGDAQVVVVGSAGLDLLLAVPELPAWDSDTTASDVARWPGGKGLNQAVAASTHGTSVALVAAMASDIEGRRLTTFLEKRGVGVDLLMHRPRAVTPTTVVLVDPGGRAAFIEADPWDALQLSIADIEQAESSLHRARVILATFEVPLPVLERVRTVAAKTEATFILNPAPLRRIEISAARRLAASATVVVPNAAELSELLSAESSAEPATLAKQAAAVFDNVVCLTASEEGCYLLTGGSIRHFPTRGSAAPVDTTGASDVFCGVLSAELARHTSLEEAVSAANIAAEASTRYFAVRKVAATSRT